MHHWSIIKPLLMPCLTVRKMASSKDLSSESPSIRRRSVITAAAPVFAVKSANTLVPSWHIADDECQERTRTDHRTTDNAPPGFDFIKRVTISSTRQHFASHHAKSSHHRSRPKAFLGPNMRLGIAGRHDNTQMDEDIPRYRPRVNLVP